MIVYDSFFRTFSQNLIDSVVVIVFRANFFLFFFREFPLLSVRYENKHNEFKFVF